MSGNLNPGNSPGSAPRATSRGVRRLNRVPMLLICGLMGIVIFAVIYGFHERLVSEQAKLGSSQSTTPQAGSAASALQGAQSSGLIVAPSRTTAPATALGPQPQQTRQLNPIEQAQLRAWSDYEQRKEAIDTAHYQALVTAIGAGANVNAQGGGSSLQLARAGAGVTPDTGSPSVPAINPSATPQGGGYAGGGVGGVGGSAPGYVSYGGLLGGGTVIPPANPNANDQAGKQGFLAQSGSTGSDDYLNAGIQHPESPHEVIAGTVIPATMIGGIDSDLPGEIIGQVRENVFDTATGKYLLIPQGSRLVGVYSSAVTYGQTRVLVAWNRLIYPNGDSIDLGQMPGSDVGGYAGFNDEVNNHYLRIFGSAILASLFSAGAQLSQPQNSNGNVNSTQILAASLGQQANTVGTMLISRGLDIQPTLKIRNGYLFNIMVTKDMVLQPWQGMQPLTYGAPSRNN